MNGFSFGLVLVALQAFCGVGVLVQRDGVNCGAGAHDQQGEKGDADPYGSAKLAASGLSRRSAEPDGMGKKSHCNTEKRLMLEGCHNAD
jgi:hypothetical protein